MNTSIATIYASSTLSAHGAQLLLMLALVCFVVGAALVERRSLRSFWSALSRFGRSARRAAPKASL
jgi:hypothetical protein